MDHTLASPDSGEQLGGWLPTTAFHSILVFLLGPQNTVLTSRVTICEVTEVDSVVTHQACTKHHRAVLVRYPSVHSHCIPGLAGSRIGRQQPTERTWHAVCIVDF
jgi:hypothetical protein